MLRYFHPLAAMRAVYLVHRARIVMASPYAARYLGHRALGVLATLHYALVGWRRQAVINPFIDPAFLASRGGLLGLAAYLERPELWGLPPGRDFDPIWYRSNYMEPGSAEHPFLHFWNFGFDAGYMPSRHFDIHFFKRVIATHRADKKVVAYERAASADPCYPRNQRELKARQDAFRAQTKRECLVNIPTSRRYLIFIQSSSDHVHELDCDTRSFDILVNIYDRKPECLPAGEIVIFQRGSKATAVCGILAEMPGLFLRYEAVMLLDDDIEITAGDIDRAFEIFAREGLDLAQPSLTADSFCAFEALKQPLANPDIIPVTAVEIMMPILSRRVFETCGGAFAAAVSGWGVDLLLGKQVRERLGGTAALLPQVVAAHRRPIDREGGAFYRYLASYGIDPMQEVEAIAIEYGLVTGRASIRTLQSTSSR